MTQVTLENDAWMSCFATIEKESAQQPEWLAELRRSAMARFAEIGFPRTSQEEWRFTNVSSIANTPFRPAPPARRDAFTPARIERLTFGGADQFRVVFVNGRFQPELSSPGETMPAGLTFMNLARALATSPELVRPWLAGLSNMKDHAFVALNTALMEDGAFLHVAPGAVIERPVHIVYATAGSAEPVTSQPRTLIVAGASSQVRIVESYAGTSGVYFTNAVTEIVAGENAVVDHYKLQNEGPEAFHVASTDLKAEANSVVVSHSISFGGGLVRNDVTLLLDGEGAEGTINGLYVVTGSQHVDNHTRIDHAKPRCASHELYKGVLDGRSRAIFNGRIRVFKDAQKTDSKQTNKNLLLSNDALVNTNPQLEIYADDVKCTHGATIGQLDETALFYLRSRGIPLALARHILTYAFANDVVERIRIPELRTRLDEYLVHRLRDEGMEES